MRTRPLARRTAPAFLCALTLVALPAAAQQAPTPPSQQPPAPPASLAPAAPVGPIDVDRVVAVANDKAILYSELLEEILMRRAQGLQIPTDSAEREKLELDVLNEMVDSELLIQRATRDTISVDDDELGRRVDAEVKRIRSQFASENEFRGALRQNGLGTPEQYRQRQIDILRRGELQRELIQKLRRDGKLSPAPVTDSDVTEAYERSKASIPKREAMIGFKQVVVAPKPSAAARTAARARAESLLVELSKGGDFGQIAKRESMDPGSKDLGGDLGWNRRGKMLKEFDDMMFALPPGRVSPIVETAYGYHVIKVDRVRPSEVKARHILIRPKLDSTDTERARGEADSVKAVLVGGGDMDALIERHHDPIENSSLPEFPRAQLPGSYAQAIPDSAAVGTLIGPFAIEDAANNAQKFVVLRVTMSVPAGEYPEAEVRLRLREQVAEAKTIRRLVDNLREASYVDVRLGAPAGARRASR